MARITIGLGGVLVLLGLIGYFATQMASWTALIPAIFGVVFIILGAIAHRADQRGRKITMHIAVVVAVIGLLGPAMRLIGAATGDEPFTIDLARLMQLIMIGLLLVYLALCVRSFVEARKQQG